MEEKLRLVIKNPAQPSRDFPLEMPMTASVGDLKNELQRAYPGQPRPTSQKLIFAGRILVDDAQALTSVFTPGKYDLKTPQAIHLVLPPPSSLHSSSAGIPAPGSNRVHMQPDLRRSAPAGLGGVPHVHQPPADQAAPLPPHGQPHPRFVPGNGFVPPPMARQPPAAAAAPAPQGDNAPQRAGFLGLQNWGLLLKILLILYILSQGGDVTRIMMLTGAAFMIYLYQVGMFPRIPRPAFMQPAAPPAAAPNPPAAGNEAQAGSDQPPAAAAPVPEPQRTGFLREVENLLLPFIYSLLPTWQPQAVQPMPMPGARPHQD